MNSKIVVLAILALTSSAGATCDHPYYPAALGMSWTYSNSLAGSDFDTTTLVVSADAQSYVTETLSEANNSREKVTCQPDGSIVIANYFSFFELEGSSSKGASVVYSGVSIPAPNLWVIGTQWTYASTFRNVSVYKTAPIIETGTEKVQVKIVGTELISVPAGEFTALKVIRTINSYRTVAQNRLSTISKETRTETIWYAREVGIIKFSGKDVVSVLTNFVKP